MTEMLIDIGVTIVSLAISGLTFVKLALMAKKGVHVDEVVKEPVSSKTPEQIEFLRNIQSLVENIIEIKRELNEMYSLLDEMVDGK